MRYLIDTCVLSELVRKAPDKKVVAWIQSQDETSLHLSVLTIGELQRGISKLAPSSKQRRLQHWVEEELSRRFTGRLLAIDREIASRWGRLSGTAEKIGKKIPAIDGLLAATALVFGMTLVTRNTSDMQATGVQILDPWVP